MGDGKKEVKWGKTYMRVERAGCDRSGIELVSGVLQQLLKLERRKREVTVWSSSSSQKVESPKCCKI